MRTLRRSRAATARGRRAIALDEHTVDVLKRFKRMTEPNDHDLLFRFRTGSPLSPIEVSRRFVLAVEAAGLRRIRLHDLRHTHATLALQAGVHPKIVSERLGHATVSFTLDVYSHAIPHLQREAAREIANLILGDPRSE